MRPPIKHFYGIYLSLTATTYVAGAFADSVASRQTSPPQPDVRNNLKQLGTALLMYAQDYDEVLPPMEDEAKTRQLLVEYVEAVSVFVNPNDKKPFRFNGALSGRPLSEIYKRGYDNQQRIIAVYEATARKDGGRFAFTIPKPLEYTKEGIPAWEVRDWEYMTDYSSMAPQVEDMTWSQWHLGKKASQIP